MADGEGGPDWGRDYDLLAVFARRLVPPSLRHRFRESDLVQDTLMIAHKKRDELAHLDPTARGMGFRNLGASEVRHVVVKGGTNIHVYDYDGSVTQDGRLIPPKNPGGDCPEISWFAICYAE